MGTFFPILITQLVETTQCSNSRTSKPFKVETEAYFEKDTSPTEPLGQFQLTQCKITPPKTHTHTHTHTHTQTHTQTQALRITHAPHSTHTFCHAPGILATSDLAPVDFNHHVAAHHGQWHAVLHQRERDSVHEGDANYIDRQQWPRRLVSTSTEGHRGFRCARACLLFIYLFVCLPWFCG